ncbi:CRISPR-associated protein, Cmr4 family (plasmid) [Cylindrospermum stagnale PCC 7417]|uniref:CRISPR-associated protein, Cmr4 family n=1 Tax=Cylindrospermum stagnale PCC 7417 TaxID=56107 RepID=K9XAE4_9NOST|nr:type III-B CRISPR module RAMP protein Cmr4 [Cylindrospermum stagnale]AFZ28587.1 CRISPR-associated protein, Cmr4 family [Cylindrospermum stagnale PCC 7417]
MAPYKRQRYLFMTLDPVHIGTGGYRLGRVDNSIVREPGTKIPKIPGTSLHGAARSYAAQLYETPEAAGQSHDQVPGNIADNPVCYTFGYIKKSKDNEQGKAYSGVVNIFDAHIVLFPVHSIAGPVWVSTVERLQDAGFTVNNVSPTWNTDTAVLTWNRTDPLNLGWLMLQVSGEPATITAPLKWSEDKRWQEINKKIVLVKDTLFSQIVNSNLEVRTSVAINPDTGAAEEGALFTYEAIPRATFLTADVVLDDYRSGEEGWALGEIKETGKKKEDKTKNQLPGEPWTSPLDVVRAGFKLIEWLGVGGMGTRGFGRMAMVGNPLEKEFGKEQSNEQ